jgi:hypothetical protein
MWLPREATVKYFVMGFMFDKNVARLIQDS